MVGSSESTLTPAALPAVAPVCRGKEPVEPSPSSEAVWVVFGGANLAGQLAILRG